MDIREILGNAPQEAETTGTSGRMRLPDDRGALLKGLSTVAELGTDFMTSYNKSQKESEDASMFALAVDASIGASMDVPPELTTEMKAVGSKLNSMESQGLSPARIAQRRASALRKLIRENPMHAETIVKGFNQTGNEVVLDLQAVEKEQMEQAMANRKYGLEEGRKLLVGYGVDITGMNDEQVIEAMRPLMQHQQTLKLAKEELDMLRTDTELTQVQRMTTLGKMIPKVLDAYMATTTTQVEAIFQGGGNLDQKAVAVADLLGQKEVELRTQFAELPAAEFDQKLSAFFAYKELAMKRAEGKLEGVELAAVERQNKTIQAFAQLGLYQRDPTLATREAQFNVIGNAMRFLPQFDAQKLGNSFVTKMVSDTMQMGKTPNARVMNGTEVRSPDGAVLVTREQGIQAAESYVQGFGRAGDTEVTPEDKRLVAGQLTTLVNEFTQNNTPQAMNALIRTYANPNVALRLDQNDRVTQQFRQVAEPLVQEYAEKTLTSVANRLEANSDKYTISYDKDGLPLLNPISGKYKGSASQLKSEEALLRDAIKAHTHMFRGDTNYTETIKLLSQEGE